MTASDWLMLIVGFTAGFLVCGGLSIGLAMWFASAASEYVPLMQHPDVANLLEDGQ